MNYDAGTFVQGPDIYGMSGGGLWHIPPKQLVEPGGYIKKTLVAIMIEWPVKNRKVIVTTRIDVFTELIRQKYGLDLTTSTTLHLAKTP